MTKNNLKVLIESLDSLPPLIKSARLIIDSCLDIMNDFENTLEFQKFKKFDLRLTMNGFVYLLNNEDEEISINYWQDSIAELKFDLNRIYRLLD
jgi:hypothetical protein